MSVKSETLRALEENRGTCLSGEGLAQRLGVTRAAVWKAMEQLKEEGYPIQSVPGRGYCLGLGSDLLSREGICLALPQRYAQLPVTVYKTVDSTNLAARRAVLDNAPSGSLFVAEEQTAGRGRMGRSFYSPAHQGIYMSLLLRPKMEMQDAVLLTTAASVAVCRAVEESTGISLQIKWVNDLYGKGRKICGILTEAVADMESGTVGSIILGVGINFRGSPQDFPSELREIVGALFEEQPSLDRNRLTAAITTHLLDQLAQLEQGDRSYLEEYRRRSLLLGQPIWIIQGEQRRPGVARKIDGQGGLVVETEEGMLTLHSGEVSIRLRG